MRSLFSQPYEEEFARLTIMQQFPENNYQLERVKDDPPDLEEKNKSVGIEVTRVPYNKDYELFSAFAEYKGKHKNEIPQKLLNKIDKQEQGLIYDDDNIVIGASSEVREELYVGLRQAYINKTIRLNKDDYPRYDKDMLFVFNSDGFCFKDDLEKISSRSCIRKNMWSSRCMSLQRRMAISGCVTAYATMYPGLAGAAARQWRRRRQRSWCWSGCWRLRGAEGRSIDRAI